MPFRTVRLARGLVTAFWFVAAAFILSGCSSFNGGLVRVMEPPLKPVDLPELSANLPTGHAMHVEYGYRSVRPGSLTDVAGDVNAQMSALREGITIGRASGNNPLKATPLALVEKDRDLAVSVTIGASKDVRDIVLAKEAGKLGQTDQLVEVDGDLNLSDPLTPDDLAALEDRLRSVLSDELAAARAVATPPPPVPPTTNSPAPPPSTSSITNTVDQLPRPGVLSYVPVSPTRANVWVPSEWNVAGLVLRDGDRRDEIQRAALPEGSAHHLYPVNLETAPRRFVVALYSDPARPRESAAEVGFPGGFDFATARQDWDTPDTTTQGWRGPRP